MNLKQLEYFLAIVEEGQITAAAQKLHISQPPLSYQIHLLEKELGAKVFVRGSKGITLTESGKQLKQRAEQILSLAELTKNEIGKYHQGKSGTLRIGTVSTSAGLLPNKEMQQLTADYPHIHFEIYEDNTFNILDKLKNGMIELGVVRTPFNNQNIEGKYFNTEPMIAVFGEPLQSWSKKETVALADLSEQPLVIYRRFEQLIHATFADQQLHTFISCTCDDGRTAITWAKSGMGIAIVPASIGKMMKVDKANYKTIDYPEWWTKLAIIWLAEAELSPIAKRLTELF